MIRDIWLNFLILGDPVSKTGEYIFSKDGNAGPVSTKLYEKLLAIQNGEVEDKPALCIRV